MASLKRLLTFPKNKSFFLFGARGVGKSTWIEKTLDYDFKINLLENRTYLELLRDPSLLEAKLGHLKAGSWVVIDEVQKIPELLTEVHRLIEDRKFLFALTGSSARKLKKGGADLLGGRAIRRWMEPFTAAELQDQFDLDTALKWGTLPLVYLDIENAAETLEAYAQTYLREEIKEEGLVRKLDSFVRFLEIASLLNAQLVNADAIARDAKIPRSSVEGYFSILEDTLVGFRLPAYQPKAKVKETSHPKFYWFDSGVARACANLLSQEPESGWMGGALETYVFHELRVYNHVFKKMKSIFYYNVPSGLEVDFVIELESGSRTKKPEVVMIEVKLAKKWDRSWNRSMISLKETGALRVSRCIGIYCGTERLTFGEVEVLPVEQFLVELYSGRVY